MFGRVLTAMVTPFDEDGNIDFSRTERLIEHLVANGTEGLVVAGTTGESPTLSSEEKRQLFRFVVEKTGGRIPVIAGTGSNNTRASYELTKQATDLGVDGIMLVTPYYNKPSQEGLYQHFKTVAGATDLPVMLYNVPGRTASRLEPETVIRLAEVKNISSIKEASGDLEAIAKIISETDEAFALYSGDDSMTLPILSIGGHGVVSVASHIIGHEMQKMVQHFFAGNIKQASACHLSLLPLMKAMFMAPSPAPVKAALNLSGIPVGRLRLPLVPLTAEQEKQLALIIRSCVKDEAS